MKRPSTEEARRQAQNVVIFDRGKIDGIIIQNGDQKIEIRRRENKWRLERRSKTRQMELLSRICCRLGGVAKGGDHPRQDIDADKSKLTSMA